jgi:predicted RNA-binding Zn ribbon-like protein
MALAAAGESTETDDVKETLQALTEAAARVVNRQRGGRKADKDINTLRVAIARAERVLSLDGN